MGITQTPTQLVKEMYDETEKYLDGVRSDKQTDVEPSYLDHTGLISDVINFCRSPVAQILGNKEAFARRLLQNADRSDSACWQAADFISRKPKYSVFQDALARALEGEQNETDMNLHSSKLERNLTVFFDVPDSQTFAIALKVQEKNKTATVRCKGRDFHFPIDEYEAEKIRSIIESGELNNQAKWLLVEIFSDRQLAAEYKGKNMPVKNLDLLTLLEGLKSVSAKNDRDFSEMDRDQSDIGIVARARRYEKQLEQ